MPKSSKSGSTGKRKGRRFACLSLGRWELFLMRLFFAAVVYLFMSGNLSVTEQEVPVGLAHFMDVTWFGRPESLAVVRWVLLACLVCYAAGYLKWLCVPIACFLVAGYGSLLNSSGKITHHSQIIALVLLVLAVWYVAAAIRERVRGGGGADSRLETERMAVWFAQQAIVATYVVTALTKIWVSDFEWHKRAKYFPLQLEKTRMSQYYNRLGDEKSPDGISSWFSEPLDGLSERIQGWFLESPNLGRTFLVMGLLLELFAFLALIGRRWGAIVGLFIVLFHLTISRVMSLDFSYNMLVVMIFLVNVPYWVSRLKSGPPGGADASQVNHG